MKRNLLILLSLGLLIAACDTASQTQKTAVQQQSLQIPTQEHSVQAVNWQQQAAEYNALCIQAYNLARFNLDIMLDTTKMDLSKLAIVADLDETVVDNSAYNAKMIELDEAYQKSRWIEWGDEISATAVPGSIEFFKYAASRGIETFYISNRYPEQMQVTLDNLNKLDLPFVDEAHVMLRNQSSGKLERREKVEETHHIIMLIGDNLADFSDLFEKQNSDRRHALVDSLAADFGSRFILIPNVMYGDWQTNGIYEGRYDWTESQRDSIRHKKLISY